MTGDLPPSSSVTGTRWSLAAFITMGPTGVLPVKTRWSKAKVENVAPTVASLMLGEIFPDEQVTVIHGGGLAWERRGTDEFRGGFYARGFARDALRRFGAVSVRYSISASSSTSSQCAHL